MPGPKDFGYLLAQSQQLTAHIDEQSIPSLQKGPSQLSDAAAVMAVRSRAGPATAAAKSRRASAAVEAAERNAAIRLLGRDFDADKLSKQVTSMDFKHVASFEALGDTDVAGYLRHHHDMLIVTAIAEVRGNAETEADEADWAHLREEWVLAKQRLQQDLGLRHGEQHAQQQQQQLQLQQHPHDQSNYLQMEQPSFLQTPARGVLDFSMGIDTPMTPLHSLTPMSVAPTSAVRQLPQPEGHHHHHHHHHAHHHQQQQLDLALPATPAVSTAISTMDPSMQQHAAVVRELNASRGHYPLATEFAKSSRMRASGGAEFAYNQCLHLLRRMLREHDSVLPPQGFAGCRSDAGLLDLLVRGAQEYLEEQYLNHVFGRVQQARTGGVPGVVPAVQAFVRQQLQQQDQAAPEGDGPQLQGLPLWRQAYLCIRCGQADKALELVQLAVQQGQAGIEPELVAALEEHCSGAGFACSDRAFLRSLLQNHERAADPFKQAIANLLSRSDPEFERPEVGALIEDYVWQRLVFCRDGGSAETHGRYDLAQLSQTILKFGDSHFDRDGQDPFAYAKLLLMCCEFERAVNYLWQRGLLVEAVHCAITLNHSGALAVGKQDAGAVDFALLLNQYIHRFARTEPRQAVEYLLLLRDPEQHAALVQLLLETRQFAALVGTMGADGLAREGALWSHLPREQVHAVVVDAARHAHELGQFADAVDLFQLCGEHATVMAILNAQLGQVLCPPNATRDYWKNKAVAYVESLAQTVVQQVDETLTLQLLLNLTVFFDLAAAGKWFQALELAGKLDLLPEDDAPDAINAKVLLFDQLDESVRRSFHHVIVKAMECYYRLYDETRRHMGPASANAALQRTQQQKLEDLRRRASALVTFSGLLNYRIPEDTNLRLTRYEVSMM